MAVTYRLKHVGINCENEAEAKKLVSLLCHLFNMETGHENDTHTFVSTAFEVMKHNQIGTHGHIALQTDDGLVQQHLIQHAAQNIAVSFLLRRNFDCLRDCAS